MTQPIPRTDATPLPDIPRTVGDSLHEIIGRQIMLDVHAQMNDQPDRWVLLPVVLRRLRGTLDEVGARVAIGTAVVKGWLEVDETWVVWRVRLTATGRKFFKRPAFARMRQIEQPAHKGRRVIRRRLKSRHAPMAGARTTIPPQGR
jgi:hypothetical protein